VKVMVTLDFVDLANPVATARPTYGDRHNVWLGFDHPYTSVAVTAGEAQVIAEAWNRIADEIVERERGAA
jgi:hypothetical protein